MITVLSVQRNDRGSSGRKKIRIYQNTEIRKTGWNMLKLIPFDIFRPKLLLAISVRVVPSVSFLLRMCTLRICSRPFTSGKPTVTRRSNRPGRSRALSKMSERLVAATTMTPLLPSKPSISVRILSMIQEHPGIQERSLEDLRTFSRQSLQNRIGKAGTSTVMSLQNIFQLLKSLVALSLLQL